MGLEAKDTVTYSESHNLASTPENGLLQEVARAEVERPHSEVSPAWLRVSVPRGAAFAFPALGVQVRIATQLCGSASVESLTIGVCACSLPCKQSRVGDGSATECLPCRVRT